LVKQGKQFVQYVEGIYWLLSSEFQRSRCAGASSQSVHCVSNTVVTLGISHLVELVARDDSDCKSMNLANITVQFWNLSATVSLNNLHQLMNKDTDIPRFDSISYKLGKDVQQYLF
jgi:hypothetical protein